MTGLEQVITLGKEAGRLDWLRRRVEAGWGQWSWSSGWGTVARQRPKPEVPGDWASSIPAGSKFQSSPAFHRWERACSWVPAWFLLLPTSFSPSYTVSIFLPLLCTILTLSVSLLGYNQHDMMYVVSCPEHTDAFANTQEKLCYWLACVQAQSLSCVWLFAILWIVACQAPLSMGIFQARILEWVAISSSGDLPHPEIVPTSPALTGRFFITEPPAFIC